MMRMTSVWFAALCAVLCVLFISHHAIAQQTQQLTDEQLFDPNHVIDIRITLPAEDWDTIRLQTRSFVGSLTMEAPVSPFTHVRGDIEIDGVLIKDVGIRKKGFLGSLNDQRPSLKIRFDKYIDQDPIRGVCTRRGRPTPDPTCTAACKPPCCRHDNARPRTNRS